MTATASVTAAFLGLDGFVVLAAAEAGGELLVYEIDPVTGTAVAGPTVGSRAHEGLRFYALGNLYVISERSPGSSYRFTADRGGDLTRGQLYALKVTNNDGDNDPLTGSATLMPLDHASVEMDSDAAAAAVGATGYNRPEDVEAAQRATSAGRRRGRTSRPAKTTTPITATRR